MRIGVYVGSFNPPHEGHRHVAQYVLDEKLVDQVLFLPTPNYWDKKDLVDVADRITMLKIYEKEGITVDTIHNSYPYTYQVLRSLKKDYPNYELFLIIGSDNLEKLHQWKHIGEVLKNKIIVLKRGKICPNSYLKSYEKNFIYCEDFEFIDVSSTQIRQGDSLYLDPFVRKYIKEKKLYEGN